MKEFGFYGSFNRVSCFILILLGSTVILGWQLDISVLVRVMPGFIAMNPVTALNILLTGVALCLTTSYSPIQQRLITFLSIWISLSGLLRLSDFLFNTDIGINHLLFASKVQLTDNACDIALATAFNFALSGIALLLQKNKRTIVYSQTLAFIVFFIGLISFINYLYGNNVYQGWGSFTHMAIHTSIAFILISCSLIFSHPETGIMKLVNDSGMAGKQLRLFLPVTLVVVILLGWLKHLGQEAGYFNTDFGTLLLVFTLSIILTFFIFLSSYFLTQQEKKASEFSNRFFDLYNKAPIGYHTATMDGLIKEMNEAELKMLGYEKSEVVNKLTRLDILTPQSVEIMKTLVPQIIRNEKVENVELEMQRKDGSVFPVLLSMSVLKDESGKAIMGRSIIVDITERKRSEKALHESREKFQKIFELSAMGIGITELETGKIVEVNPGFMSPFHYTREELIGKTTIELGIITPELRADMVRNLQEKGSLTNYEIRMFGKGGSPVDCLLSLRLSEIDGKKYNIFLINDITEQKKIEKKFQALLESAPDAIIITDSNGNIKLINALSEKLFDYDRAELINQKIELLIPERFSNHAKLRAEYFKNPQPRGMGGARELFARKKDGSEIPVEIRLSPIETEDGLLVSAAIRDVTDRKKVEEEVRKAKELFQKVFEESPTGMTLTSLESGMINSVNEAFFKIIGFNQEEVKGKTARELGLLPTGPRNLLDKLLKNGSLKNEELRVRTKSGQIIDCLFSSEIVVINESKQLLSSFHDITNIKNLERQLQEARDVAESSLKLQEQFLANMSHEIRTPMNSIIGFTNILEKKNLNQEDKAYVKIIQRAGESLLTIINDILDVSKIESGMMQFEEKPLSIKDLFKSLHIMFNQRAKEKNLQLSLNYEASIPDQVLGDPTRLTQILNNLLSNALKFTSAGSVHVFAKTDAVNEETVSIKFTVKDSGIGIPKNKLETIFERFTQAESDTTRKYGGSGLGLNIVKNLVTLQGGSINVESESGKGSVFSFTIPFKKSTASTIDVTNQRELLITELPKELKVLIAEDNEMNIILIKTLFRNWGVIPTVVTDGKQVTEKLQQDSYDIILMDIQMPEMDGYQATNYIRTELKDNTPIIALTAHAIAGERERCIRAGMNGYVSKPIDADLLLHTINSLTEYSHKKKTEKKISKPPFYEKSIDLAYLNKVTNEDKDIIKETLELFVNRVPAEMEKLEAAVNNLDFKSVNRISHSLKSSLITVGAQYAYNIAEEMEKESELNKNIGKLRELMPELKNEFLKVITEIQIERFKE